MYTINNIAFENYGLHISDHTGHSHLPEPKQQLFNTYEKEGYQITKRKANELDLKAFIIADNITDFITKCANLRALFTADGVKAIELNNGVINCFAKDGFKIENVRVMGSVIAKFQIKLTIVWL